MLANANKAIRYIHPENESFPSRIIKLFARVLRFKKKIERDIQSGKINHQPAKIPDSLVENAIIETSEIAGHTVWTLKPKQNQTDAAILFLHGGAYIYSMQDVHWQFAEELLRKTNATIIIPDYPLAPQATALDAFAFMDALYAQILETTSLEQIILMGDSAGAGLALGFAQSLRDAQKPLPQQVILLAPFLDVSMRNPDNTDAEKQCHILTIKGLQLAGTAYAGNLDVEDYRVSPIYGDFSDLPNLSIFIGTHDVFIADVRKLASKLERENIAFNYFEYPKMVHDWVVLAQLPEAQHALGQVVNLITNTPIE